jgi:hypothetical protein
MVKRAPQFLRAVKTEHLFSEIKTDVLDQPEDAPAGDEKVYVYQIQGRAGTIHLNARGRDGKDITGWWALASYRYLPDVDGEALRDNDRWQAWATAKFEGGSR